MDSGLEKKDVPGTCGKSRVQPILLRRERPEARIY